MDLSPGGLMAPESGAEDLARRGVADSSVGIVLATIPAAGVGRRAVRIPQPARAVTRAGPATGGRSTIAFDSLDGADYGRPLNAPGRGKTVTKAELGTKRICPNCGAKYYDLNRSPIICPRCGTRFELAAATARARPVPAKPVPVPLPEEVEVEKEVVETVSLEEADDEVAETGAVEVEAGDDEEIEGEEDDTFLANEDDDDEEDVEDIVGDVDQEDT